MTGVRARAARFLTRLHRPLIWALPLMGFIVPWGCRWNGPSAAPDPLACTVQHIYDGDTLRMSCGGERLQVRLYCVDAPELDQTPWGKASRDRLRRIAPKRVQLVPRDRDTYGRVVGEVLADDAERANLNLAMVRSGHAAVYPRYCNEDVYRRAEQEARYARAGIWRKPGPQQEPWKTRH